jgi:hypothetical protein
VALQVGGIELIREEGRPRLRSALR